MDSFDCEDFVDLITLAETEAAKEINRLLDDAYYPRNLYWSASQTIHDRRKGRAVLISEALRNNDFADLSHKLNACASKITLIGSPAEKFITVYWTSCDHIDEDEKKLSPQSRLIYESLAEQILQSEKAEYCSLVCLYGSIIDRKGCCGRRDELERLYERLPDKYRKHITLPPCVRVR